MAQILKRTQWKLNVDGYRQSGCSIKISRRFSESKTVFPKAIIINELRKAEYNGTYLSAVNVMLIGGIIFLSRPTIVILRPPRLSMTRIFH